MWGTDLTTLPARPRIAIPDSGVDATHEERAGPSSPLVAGRSSCAARATPRRRRLQARHPRGGIAAAPANGVGIVGVAPALGPTAQVIPVQIANRFGESSDLTMIKESGTPCATAPRSRNISAGGEGEARAFQEAILWATRQGAVIVASVGNDYRNTNYPAAYRRVLGVGAQCDAQVTTDCPRPNGVAAFSNCNRSVDVIAPGVNVPRARAFPGASPSASCARATRSRTAPRCRPRTCRGSRPW